MRFNFILVKWVIFLNGCILIRNWKIGYIEMLYNKYVIFNLFVGMVCVKELF